MQIHKNRQTGIFQRQGGEGNGSLLLNKYIVPVLRCEKVCSLVVQCCEYT